jgi:hypothetical protein
MVLQKLTRVKLFSKYVWDRQGISYPPEANKMHDNETIPRVKEDVGWGIPQPGIFCIQIA